MTVADYCQEEVERQGHDILALDGIERVGWMLDAWCYALLQLPRKPEISDALALGQLIERQKNAGGLRDCPVWIRSKAGPLALPAPELIHGLLADLFRACDEMTPLEFYKNFEEIHPFVDGNGRIGKILLNWLAGTLLEPTFPPNNLWGRPVRNP